jgi:hypothetical protein
LPLARLYVASTVFYPRGIPSHDNTLQVQIIIPHTYIGVAGRIILKYILWKYGLEVWIGFIWLRIGTDGGLL